MKLSWGVIVFLSLITCACISTGPAESTTSEEKAITYLEMGVRYMEMGELRTAKESLEKALDWDSNNASIHDAIAVLSERIAEPDNAASHYRSSLRIDDENPQTQNNYGRFLCEQGQFEEGMRYLESAVNMPLNNRKWFALTNAGRCILKQGDKIKAEAYFREALLLQSDYAPALLEMLKISYSSGQYLSARAFLQRYQGNVTVYNAESLWYGMQVERALEHRSLAEQYRKKLLTDYPLSEEASRVLHTVSE